MNDPLHLLPTNPKQPVILVVDDEVMVRNIVRIALEAEGYFVLAAGNGQEALEISRSFSGGIHAALCDISMPLMDGLRLREQLLVERPGIKIVLMSGQTASPPVQDCPFLPKPFRIETLKQRMREFLGDLSPASEAVGSA